MSIFPELNSGAFEFVSSSGRRISFRRLNMGELDEFTRLAGEPDCVSALSTLIGGHMPAEMAACLPELSRAELEALGAYLAFGGIGGGNTDAMTDKHTRMDFEMMAVAVMRSFPAYDLEKVLSLPLPAFIRLFELSGGELPDAPLPEHSPEELRNALELAREINSGIRTPVASQSFSIQQLNSQELP